MSETMQSTPRLSARLWRHFKRNFLGYVALIVAISMTPLPAYAASKIGAKQLKKNAVTTVKIKNGAVTGPKIAANAVTGDKIANGAVTSSQIKDGSVSAGDLASGAAYKNIIVKRVVESGVADDWSSRNVICPAGMIAIGGGASANVAVNRGTLQMSVPVKSGFLTLPVADEQVPDGWRSDLYVTAGSATEVWHYAICASK